MNALKTNSELRQEARAQLKGKWKFIVLLTLIYTVISSIPSGLTNGFDHKFSFIGFILSLLISGPLALGLAICFLKFVRGEELRFENLFDGFKNFLPAFLLTILIGIFTVLWTFVFLIGGIVAALRYSMAYYILADNPDISAMDAIKQSKEMMKGNKWKLFCLGLSFIGWAILSIFTLFIGLLWLIPYIQTSMANFYEDLKTSVEAKAL